MTYLLKTRLALILKAIRKGDAKLAARLSVFQVRTARDGR